MWASVKDFVFTMTTVVLVPIIGWAVNLNSRTSVLESKVEGQPEKDRDLKDFIQKLMDAKFEAVDGRLERIERKVLNGGAR